MASMSAGSHHAVSTNRFGCSGSTRHSQARSEIAAWARISRASVNSPDRRTVSWPERRDAAAGVDEHRDAALVGERHDVAHGRLGQREALGPRVQLDALGAGVEAAARLGQRVGARVEAAEGDEPAAGVGGRREHAVVGRRVAVRLVHGEHDGARARRARARPAAARASGGRRRDRSRRRGCGRRTAPGRRGRRACGPTRGAGSRRRRAWAGNPIQAARRMADTRRTCNSAASASASRPSATRSRARCSCPTRASGPGPPTS